MNLPISSNFLNTFSKMGCLPECSPDLIPLVLGGGCEAATMKGGLFKIGFMKCDVDFDDVTGGSITQLASWTSLIESNRLIMSSEILGSKAEDSFTRTRISSCQSEIVTGGTKTFNFSDFNADLSNLRHISWWAQIQDKYKQLKVLFVTCDDYVYGPYDNGTWSINASEVREETSESPTRIVGSITIVDDGKLTIPAYVPGLVGII